MDILMLPGMMLDARSFAHQIARLKGGSHRVRVADLSAHDSVEALAENALRTAPPSFALIGLSMGGIVAFEIMRRSPERITHLALLDTTPRADSPTRSALRLEQMAQVESGELRQVIATSMKPLYLAAKNRQRHELLAQIMSMGMDLGSEVFLRQSRALRDRKDSRNLLPEIGCPTLALCGREDQLCPPTLHVEMATAIPRATLVVLSDTGHLSTMESPAEVYAQLEILLARAA